MGLGAKTQTPGTVQGYSKALSSRALQAEEICLSNSNKTLQW